jgi:hypothetical protein
MGRRLPLHEQNVETPDEAWSPGDLAECIHDHLWLDAFGRPGSAGPVLGELRVVTVIHQGPIGIGRCLGFERYAPRLFTAGCFRKVTPKADALVAYDATFLDQWIAKPEIKVAVDRWQTLASVAIVTAAGLWVGVETLVGALTRVPA